MRWGWIGQNAARGNSPSADDSPGGVRLTARDAAGDTRPAADVNSMGEFTAVEPVHLVGGPDEDLAVIAGCGAAPLDRLPRPAVFERLVLRLQRHLTVGLVERAADLGADQ